MLNEIPTNPGNIIIVLLLVFLIICALFATLGRRLFTTVLIFMLFSIVMSIIWIVLESPDLAGTEAAVGAGVTTILFFLVLRKIAAIETDSRHHKQFGIGNEGLDEDIELKDE